MPVFGKKKLSSANIMSEGTRYFKNRFILQIIKLSYMNKTIIII